MQNKKEFKNINFDMPALIKLSECLLNDNILKTLDQNDYKFTISQVVTYFETQGIAFTKTMIQNYVRVNVIPPPIDKRYYVKNHLILLTLIDTLKNIYSLEDLNHLFKPILRDMSTFEDDIIDMNLIYELYIKAVETTIEDFKNLIPSQLKKIESLVEENVPIVEEQNSVKFFTTILTLMAQSIATKQYVKMLIDEYKK